MRMYKTRNFDLKIIVKTKFYYFNNPCRINQNFLSVFENKKKLNFNKNSKFLFRKRRKSWIIY